MPQKRRLSFKVTASRMVASERGLQQQVVAFAFSVSGRTAQVIQDFVWLTTSCSVTVSFGLYVGTAGTYQRYWSENQLAGYSQSAIAWISSIQVFLIYFSGSITGPLFQMGLYRWLLGGSMLLFVFCQMMTSLCTEYYQFILAQGIGIGVSCRARNAIPGESPPRADSAPSV